ncbi:hypothetical protein Pelo_4718 [Pelomyxa schiedti]|nr:hypothetical protein Pelo_4718 [Pelomyxa schiedti]
MLLVELQDCFYLRCICKFLLLTQLHERLCETENTRFHRIVEARYELHNFVQLRWKTYSSLEFWCTRHMHAAVFCLEFMRWIFRGYSCPTLDSALQQVSRGIDGYSMLAELNWETSGQPIQFPHEPYKANRNHLLFLYSTFAVA